MGKPGLETPQCSLFSFRSSRPHGFTVRRPCHNTHDHELFPNVDTGTTLQYGLNHVASSLSATDAYSKFTDCSASRSSIEVTSNVGQTRLKFGALGHHDVISLCSRALQVCRSNHVTLEHIFIIEVGRLPAMLG